MQSVSNRLLVVACPLAFLACSGGSGGVRSQQGVGGSPGIGAGLGGISGAVGGQAPQVLPAAGGTGGGAIGSTGGTGGVVSSSAGGTVSVAMGGSVASTGGVAGSTGGAVGRAAGGASAQGGGVSALGGAVGSGGADSRSPAAVLGGLSGWHLTLPVGPSNAATSIHQPQLETYSDDYFFVTGQPSRVRFVSLFGGSRTSTGTAYARSELRQEYAGPGAVGSQSWPCATSAHTMHFKGSVVLPPPHKPEISIGQIHDAANDLLELVYKGPEDANGIGTGNGTTDVGRMEASLNNGTSSQVLDAAYRLSDIMTIDVTTDGAGNMGIQYHNERTGAVKEITEAFYGGVSGGCYFKVGNYHQACTKIDINNATNDACVGKGWVPGRYETDPLGQSILDIFELSAN